MEEKIKDAIKLLEKNGYVVNKFTEEMYKYANKCLETRDEQELLLKLPAPLCNVESFEIPGVGIWMRIPCKEGEKVYKIDGIIWKGHDWKYRSFEKAFVKETVFRLEMMSEFGKTVFRTQSEAEEALRKMNEDCNKLEK